MTDVLLRNLTDEEVAVIDARAARLRISRSEYLRRLVRRDVGAVQVTTDDLKSFAATFGDLDDAQVMSGAWR